MERPHTSKPYSRRLVFSLVVGNSRMPPKKGTMTYLSEASPEVLSLWDPSNDCDVSQIGITSHRRVRWICPEGHSWEAPVYSVSRGSRCPYCSGRDPIEGKNDLRTLRPDLAAQWSPRNEKGPECYTRRSHARVRWVCDKGHEWVARIDARVDGNGCPFCAGRKPSKDSPIPEKKMNPDSRKL